MKEHAYYLKEVKENEEKLDEIKADASKDAYDIKRFQQVLDESYMMVPDSKRRLDESIQDLVQFLESNSSDLKSSDWYGQAEEIIKQNAIEEGPAATETNIDDLVDGEAF
jgi:tubulin-specific chaperone A